MSSTGSSNSGSEWFAQRCGWRLLPCNVMVEGTSDVAYFELASRLFKLKYGRSLVGVDLSIFAAGMGDDGGTFGIAERFPTLFNLVAVDLDASGGRRFKAIALLDDDKAGQVAIEAIANSHRQIRKFESIFLLRRRMPPRTGDRRKLELDTQKANAAFGKMHCTIEDLLSQKFCSQFVARMPHAISRAPDVVGGTQRHHWTQDGKRELRTCAEQSASLADVQAVVNVLQAIRGYMSLRPGGV